MKVLRYVFFVLVAMLGGAAVFTLLVRPGLPAYRAHLLAPTASPRAGAIAATWLGVTGVLLDDGEHALLVDPFFTRPRGLLGFLSNAEIAPDEKVIADALARAGARHVDAVLISHSHFDHAMDAGVVARLTGAKLVGSASTANIGRGSGLPDNQIHLIEPGETLHFGRFSVRFIESRHAGATGGRPTGEITAPLIPPAHYLDYKLGGTYSILIEHPAGSVLHHGSAGFVPGALNGLHADAVLLGIALREDLPTYLHEVVDAVGARRVIPTHWDDFTRGLDQPMIPFPIGIRLENFFDEIAHRSDLTVQTLEAFRPVELFPPRP
ncbi:MAG TPA: MBL fold metallo-hydrolase [Nevskiaceae bacterium]|nr:MBL fold metallo-hydrolase [Nevskiaceae bacterium]